MICSTVRNVNLCNCWIWFIMESQCLSVTLLLLILIAGAAESIFLSCIVSLECFTFVLYIVVVVCCSSC